MALTSYQNGSIQMVHADALVGPLEICGVLVVPGSANTTPSLTVGGVTVFHGGTHTASGPAVMYPDVKLRLSGGDTLTAAITGTAGKIFVYIK